MKAMVPASNPPEPAAGSPSRTPAVGTAAITAGRLAAVGIIVFAALAAYHRSFHVPFLYDDEGSIIDNPTIRSLWPIWPVLRPLPGGMPVSGRPILNLSFALNYAISGLNVWSYHAVNLAIHILAGLTLFGILRRTFLRWNGLSSSRFSALAFAIALIWTLHPLQTEAVAYVSQRAESLMGLFYLLTIYCFIRGVGRRVPTTPLAPDREKRRQRPRASWGHVAPPQFIASIFFCLLGMATKEVMVSAPLIVFLYDRTFVAGTFREAWRLRMKYYLGLASTWLILIWLVLATGSRGGTAGFGLKVTPWAYALIQFQAVIHYLRLAIWPHPLVFYYGRPAAAAGIVGIDAAAVVFLLVATVYGLFLRKGSGVGGATPLRPAERAFGGQAPLFPVPPCPRPMTSGLAFAGAVFFLILAPSSSIMPVGTELMAEHRMYLSLAAVIAAAVGCAWFFVGRWAPKQGALICVVLFLAVAAGLGFMTDRRTADYRSGLTLWSDTAEKMPDNSTVRANLGLALLGEGDLPAAMAQCREAVRLNPENARAHSGLADALAQTGRRAEAIEHYQEALRIKPDLFEARNNLGIALAQSGRWPEAIEQLQAAVRLNPGLFAVHDNLAMLLARTGHLSEAAAEWEAALQLKPDDAGARAHLNRARSLERRQ